MEEPKVKQIRASIIDLIKLIESLRSPKGCPWDRRQTPRSMLIYLIEEVFELADAIEAENTDDIREELGDVLFHVFFMARMFHEMGHFSIHDVAEGITEKMIRRHPHVFGTATVDDPDDVIQNWHKIKLSEKNNAAEASVLDSIPSKLPALLRAYVLFERAAKAGFNWKKLSGHGNIRQKTFSQLKKALSAGEQQLTDREVGDMLLMLAYLAQGINVHPETALAGSLKRFEKRFKRFEKLILESGEKLESIPEAKKRRLWEKSQNLGAIDPAV